MMKNVQDVTRFGRILQIQHTVRTVGCKIHILSLPEKIVAEIAMPDLKKVMPIAGNAVRKSEKGHMILIGTLNPVFMVLHLWRESIRVRTVDILGQIV